jgi:hypothetical protein
MPQSRRPVRLWTIQPLLRQAARLMPGGVVVVLLARGFAERKFSQYRRENLGWH